VAKTLRGRFEGAVTAVPWAEHDPQPPGDLPYVQLTLERLAAEGIECCEVFLPSEGLSPSRIRLPNP
jgi:hypothetical protein